MIGCVLRVLVGLIGLAAAIAGLALAVWFAMAQFTNADIVDGPDPFEFEVQPGDNSDDVIRRLMASGIVVDDPRWKLFLWLHRPGTCLQAGAHEIPGAATPAQLFEVLCRPARARGVRVTIPEGTNIFQVADLLDSAGVVAREAFLSAVDGPDDARRHGIEADSLEGYLFPDTYDLPEDPRPSDIVERMVQRGREVMAEVGLFPSGAHLQGLTPHEVLTIASIVEEEAAVADERALIARVIYNRLSRSMPLQCDPTCVYGPDIYRERPTRSLCRARGSRYSTYVIPGLPPTPITNPGRAAIQAAVTPADNPEVLYFAAIPDDSGRHAFASDLGEHERNVARYRERSR